MRLSARVARLERSCQEQASGGPCPECGCRDGMPFRWAFEFADTDEECRSRWCGACGAQLVYAMELDSKG